MTARDGAGGEGPPAPWRNLYGRRHGKKLKPTQRRLLDELLPRLRVPAVSPAENPERRPLDPAALFAGPGALWLEIGFGGGAFSGKDPTKVDRSAAYAARYLAKNVVAAGLARRCVLQLSYAIGVARPLSIYVDTFGTGEVAEAEIEKAVAEVMDLTPRGIRTHLGLNRPIYQRTSAYGHFGRAPDNEGGFSWERTDLSEALAKAV